MRKTVFLGILLSCNAAWACAFTPSWFKRNHASLIDDASSIILVKAAAATGGCELQTVQIIMGTEADLANVVCSQQDPGVREDFSGHQKRLFWTNSTGRIDIDSECSAMPPTFEIGGTYLAILGIAPDSKQFEQIVEADDRWLEFVQSRVDLNRSNGDF